MADDEGDALSSFTHYTAGIHRGQLRWRSFCDETVFGAIHREYYANRGRPNDRNKKKTGRYEICGADDDISVKHIGVG